MRMVWGGIRPLRMIFMGQWRRMKIDFAYSGEAVEEKTVCRFRIY